MVTIQQKVEKSSLAALSDNERITVWGDQNGDQITAKVIVYSQFRGGGQQQQTAAGVTLESANRISNT